MNQLNALRERSQARFGRYQTTVIPKMFIPRDERKQFIKGQFSLTQVNGKLSERVRFVLHDENSIEHGEWFETPTSTARDYIHINELKPKRLRSGCQYRDFVQTPDFAEVGARFEDGEYIDIRAAYFSIVNLAGWDLLYAPGRWIAAGRRANDFPFPENRIARNSLVTCGEKKTKMPRVIGGQIEMRPAWNELTNLCLITFVSDVLQSIAHLATQAGAVYCNTDGFIAPSYGVARKIEQYISDFGLTSRVKMRGAGVVGGMTSYAIGDKKTVGFKNPTAKQTRSAIDRTNVQEILWLQRNLEYLNGKK